MTDGGRPGYVCNSSQDSHTETLVEVWEAQPASATAPGCPPSVLNELKDRGYMCACVWFRFSYRSSVVTSRMFSWTMKTSVIPMLCWSLFSSPPLTPTFLTYSWNKTVSGRPCFSPALITGRLCPAFFMQMEFQTHPLVGVGVVLGCFPWAEAEGCSEFSLPGGGGANKGMGISKMPSPAQPCPDQHQAEVTKVLIHTHTHTHTFLFWTMAPSLPTGEVTSILWGISCPPGFWNTHFGWGSTVTELSAVPLKAVLVLLMLLSLLPEQEFGCWRIPDVEGMHRPGQHHTWRGGGALCVSPETI